MIKLQKGDKVALIAPASGQKYQQMHFIDEAIAQLTAWGLSVTLRPQLAANHRYRHVTNSPVQRCAVSPYRNTAFTGTPRTKKLLTQRYLAADDKMRAESLITALTTPDIKAIFTTRGGYGCARLLSYLAQQNISIPSPRWLVGFSDITTLHLHFSRQTNRYLQCLHAPNLATEQFLANTTAAANNRAALYHVLFEHNDRDFSPSVAANAITDLAAKNALPADWEKQPKTGGCLSLLVTSLGTAHEIITDDKWLLIEEVGEAPYKIDRMLTHLYHAGKFNNVRGVVFGEMVQCNSPQIPVQAVIDELAEKLPCPVLSFPQFGHGEINFPWYYR